MDIKYITEKEQKTLVGVFAAGAESLDIEPEYWINGADEGVSYCLDCCEAEEQRLQDKHDGEIYFIEGGGYSSEGDSIASCEECGKLLENSLTDGGCSSEVDYFMENGFDLKNRYDCYAMQLVIEGHGWHPWNNIFDSEAEKKEDMDYYRKLHKLCRTILSQIEEFNV